MRIAPIDIERWEAVAKAAEIYGRQRSPDPDEALAQLLVWLETNPDHPARAWTKRKPSRTQMEKFRREFRSLYE